MKNSQDENPPVVRDVLGTSPSDSAAVVTFPRTDLRRLADGVEYWKRTGKRFKGAPD